MCCIFLSVYTHNDSQNIIGGKLEIKVMAASQKEHCVALFAKFKVRNSFKNKLTKTKLILDVYPIDEISCINF